MELKELKQLKELLNAFLKQENIVNDSENVGYWYDVLIDRIKAQTPSILTDKEKQYLSAVIKPFKDDVLYIMKRHPLNDKEYISIQLSYDSINFPYFDAGTMYKGINYYIRYTLEELELK